MLFVTCVKGDDEGELPSCIKYFKKNYDKVAVYLKEVTGWRVFALQMSFVLFVFVYIVILNYRTYLNRKKTEDIQFIDVVIEKYPLNFVTGLVGEG